MKLYPNPASHQTHVEFSAMAGESVTIQVSSMNGVVVLNQTTTASEGINTVSLNIGSLSPGTYAVTLQVGNTTSSKFLIVK